MKRTTKTNDGITAIYVRRSVSDKDKGNNSLSISAQKEECIRFVGECDYRIYCDDGKSATTTVLPATSRLVVCMMASHTLWPVPYLLS